MFVGFVTGKRDGESLEREDDAGLELPARNIITRKDSRNNPSAGQDRQSQKSCERDTSEHCKVGRISSTVVRA